MTRNLAVVLLSALAFPAAAYDPPPGSLVITEMNPNPAEVNLCSRSSDVYQCSAWQEALQPDSFDCGEVVGGVGVKKPCDDYYEWFEIHNPGCDPFDLDTIRVQDNGPRAANVDALVPADGGDRYLRSGEVGIVIGGRGAEKKLSGNMLGPYTIPISTRVFRVSGQFIGNHLNNDEGDDLTLVQGSTIVARFKYENSVSCFMGFDGVMAHGRMAYGGGRTLVNKWGLAEVASCNDLSQGEPLGTPGAGVSWDSCKCEADGVPCDARSGKPGSVDSCEDGACRPHDRTPPALSFSGDVVAAATSRDGAIVSFTATTARDDYEDVDAPVTCTPASGSHFPIGDTRVTCGAEDRSGNKAPEVSFDVKVCYAWSGWLSPSPTPGKDGVLQAPLFKLNGVVPMRFRLTDASAGVFDADVGLQIWNTSSVTEDGDPLWVDVPTGADEGPLFHYSTASGQYHFNLGTRNFGAGKFEIRANNLCPQPDTTGHFGKFSIKS